MCIESLKFYCHPNTWCAWRMKTFAAEGSMRHGRTIVNLQWRLLTYARRPCDDIRSSMRMWPCVMVQ